MAGPACSVLLRLNSGISILTLAYEAIDSIATERNDNSFYVRSSLVSPGKGELRPFGFEVSSIMTEYDEHSPDELNSIQEKFKFSPEHSITFDEKWDIYIHDNCFYFTRSWSGELVYKGFASVDTNNVTIYKVEFQDNDRMDRSFAINNVHFLVTTQILKRIFPHKVPANLKTDLEIALYSFSQFGNKCWYATHDDILDTVIKVKPGQN